MSLSQGYVTVCSLSCRGDGFRGAKSGKTEGGVISIFSSAILRVQSNVNVHVHVCIYVDVQVHVDVRDVDVDRLTSYILHVVDKIDMHVSYSEVF